jgi:hypothetical protein
VSKNEVRRSAESAAGRKGFNAHQGAILNKFLYFSYTHTVCNSTDIKRVLNILSRNARKRMKKFFC